MAKQIVHLWACTNPDCKRYSDPVTADPVPPDRAYNRDPLCHTCKWPLSYHSPVQVDPLDDDTNQEDPVDMTADDWSDFYGNCRRRTGMDFEEYLDHDHSMDG